ncbi:MAG: hypothetical protein IPN49_10340 [Saprospiraceae bacterium]|nr:hypothetical protein [Saprospiraceae bacterium]MBK8371710.1 hypothetical protein [Saprospiraceae bacterium]MBK8819457.1 hypothetical protein [Saprospiraceae bacterium]MBK8853441.1 hypothetical protein [Saprospiraceae bacterium]MBP6694684.1 hypothetical protein [Saprospiraceae bacterium]
MLSLVFIFSLIITGISSFIALSFSNFFIRVAGPESSIISFAGIISAYLIIGIPVLLLIAFFIRIAFKVKVRPEVNFTAWTIWFIALFFVFYAGTMTAVDFKKQQSIIKKSEFSIPDNSIYIGEMSYDFLPEYYPDYIKSPFKIYNDSLYVKYVDVQYFESDSPFVTIEQEFFARGMNDKKAIQNINKIQSSFLVNGNKINILPFIRMPKNSKWRNQGIKYKIYIPKGKNVIFEYDENHAKPFEIDLMEK